MFRKIIRTTITMVAFLMVVSLIADQQMRQSIFAPPEIAQAGNISSPSWSLTSTTENATNVTYTHTFTTATTIPSGGEVFIELRQPPGPPAPFPSFGSATLATGTTAGLLGRSITIFSTGNSINLSVTTDAAIAAGSITLKFSGVTNPSSGGVFMTNTSTSNNGTTLDGVRFSPDATGKLTIGTVKLSGTITDASTGSGIAGIRVEVHPGPNSSTFGYWSTVTDSTGAYSFAGLADGAFIFEMSPGVDPGSSNAATVSQYSRFDPVEVTISSTPQTINKALAKAQKFITGTVVYDGTSTPVSGAQVNAGSFGGGFSNTTTASNGTFTLRMNATGPVFVMVQPPFGPPPGQGGGNQGANDFGSKNVQSAFVKPIAEAETVALGTIGVKKADSTVTGKIVNPDGSAATSGAGLMNFREHSFTPLQLGSDGSFSAKVVSGGSWKVDSFDPTGNYSMPNVTFTPKKGTTNLGTIKKLNNDKIITITAKRIDGGTERAISNAQAMVFPNEPGPPYFATTNTSGVATVKVPTGFVGRAGVMPGGSFGIGKGSGGPGKSGFNFLEYLMTEKAIAQAGGTDATDSSTLFPVTGFQKVRAGDSVTSKFDKADKTLNVRTVDKNGALVTQGGFVDIALPSGFHMGCPTAGGQGTCNVVSGSLTARVMFPPDSNYAGKSKKITVSSSGSSVNLDVVEKTGTITGEVQDGSNNNAVIKDATLGINVGAFSSDGFFMGKYNPSTGTYSIAVPPDTKVRLGVMAGDPSRGVEKGGYVPNISSSEVSASDGGSTTKHVTLQKVDAVIKVTVKDDGGNIVEGANVVASNTLADIVGPDGPPSGPGPGPGGPGPEGPDFGFSGVTDENGVAEIPVAPDKYNFVVRAPGLFPTSVTQAEPKSGETKDVTVTMAKADATVKVEVNKSDGSDLEGATLQIFDLKGLVNLTVEDGDSDAGDQDGTVNGVIEVKVPKGNYITQAGEDYPDTGKVEESGYKTIEAKSKETVNLEQKTALEDNALQKPITIEASSTSASAAALPDGNTLSIPAGALSGGSSESGSSGGNPIVEVSEKQADLPETKTDTPVGTGLSINAIDSSGNQITSLNGVVSGEMHYEDSDLPPGVTEANLKAKAFNESTGIWESVQASSVDSTNNIVTFSTTHFTDFAIVATTDTTPPAAPTNISTTDVGTSGKVKVAWTKPTDSDFASVKIYRSTAEGTLGTAVHTGVTDSDREDTGLTNGTKYYYTVRSVDTSGNESTNTTQYSVIPSKSKLPKTGERTPYSSALPWAAGTTLLTTVLLAGYAHKYILAHHK